MDNYSDAIEEAFLEPLKTALVIDDDYPTLDEILLYPVDQAPEPPHSTKGWRVNEEKRTEMQDLLISLRSHTPPLIVDMHDGSDGDGDTEIVRRFHQSDFLVLDWNLEPGEDTGTKALKILEQLLNNNHFNIVVINSRKTSEEIFKEIIQKLTTINHSSWETYNGIVEPILAKLRDDADIIEGFETDLNMYIAGLALPSDMKPLEAARKIIEHKNLSFSPVLEIIGRRNLTDVEGEQLIASLMKEQRDHHRLEDEFDRFNLTWGAFKADSLWIRSESVFIAFSEKSPKEPDVKPTPPLEVAKAALIASNPRPDYLILAKLRNAIDNSGIALQGRALKMKYASALWYRNMLASGQNLLAQTEQIVQRHSEQLLNEVMNDVTDFTKQLITLENALEPKPNKICRNRFDVNLADIADQQTAFDQHNRLVSTIPISGSHLSTGHVFKIDSEYWICLAPKCSLVSAQENNRQVSYSIKGEPIQFSALQLKKLGAASSADITPNIRKRAPDKDLLYLDFGDGITIFEAKGAGSSQKYRTETFFVKQETWDFSDTFPTVNVVMQNPRGGGKPFETTCSVVDQLREEYALSLLRRVSLQSSEIGLDYTNTV